MTDHAKSNFFIGSNGIRAGWRLLIFFALILPLGYGAGLMIDRIIGPSQDRATPAHGAIMMAIYLIALLIATWIMTRIEGRTFADYGLPWRRAFGKPFWQGAGISFTSLVALLLVLRFAGVYSFGPLALHGIDILKFGAAWTIPIFIAALLEDFLYRGYLLFTLTTGIGFWTSAVITSLLMGGIHYFNPGGHGLGPVAATLYCLVTCLVIRRTGDLWMAMGIHAAWGWGVVFFFGLPSSGFPGSGHLLNGSMHGSIWLTGGEFGIEAGVPNLILLSLWGVLFFLWLRGVKYPNPAAVPDPRQQSAAFQNALRTFAPEV